MEPMKRGRGRPRPQSVIERDSRVLYMLRESEQPLTCTHIAEVLDVPNNHAYLSLCRLRASGDARRHNNAWVAIA